jgi:hypothetical protein
MKSIKKRMWKKAPKQGRPAEALLFLSPSCFRIDRELARTPPGGLPRRAAIAEHLS